MFDAIDATDIAQSWRNNAAKPKMTTLYSWLNLAVAWKIARQHGNGAKRDPRRYRLETRMTSTWTEGSCPR